MYKRDNIDDGILNRLEEHPGLSIIQLIGPFLLLRSEDRLRRRVHQMARHGLIRLVKSKRETYCFPASEVVE